MMRNPLSRTSLPRRREQRGVTLIVAMVMLVIIGLTSAAVMRNAMSSDVVANNTRVQVLAQQAAQIGLRYCERQLELDEDLRDVTVRPVAANEAAQAWRQATNWHGNSKIASAVPSDLIASGDSSVTPAFAPECMVEESAVGGARVFIVTARGFSPDYAANSDGRTTAGSVVWLQSTVRIG